ncbi:sigma-54-dependent transcriptional regulator [Desulfovibrio oxyclinae]|uniref:sigma-54-dependent transcriptional regulator n=1 Tax=Desulfovibrio oxyclinae TaxID=63560 RepID=UPI0003755AAA|nr:sigma-54 dependent transcriptional regulator [Desulfovibrio oxyclinae]
MARLHIIDDDEMTCMTLEHLAMQMGHAGGSSTSLTQGLLSVAQTSPDLLFLDVNLPDGNGLEAMNELRERAGDPVIIIVTAMGDAESAEVAIRSGAWDYLQKPLSLPKLKHSVERALRFRQRHLSPQTRGTKRDGIIGTSPKFQECLKLMSSAATSDISTLITGKTGTGKELFARAIHENSARCKGSFVIVDCASLPENLAESTLFGHRRGAFTGAENTRQGLVAQADGGSLFLDEIGEMPLAAQRVLLRVLQEKSFRPVGGDNVITSDFRLIAATNRDLDREVREGRFREDLLYRLKGFSIDLPVLARRQEDIRPLARHFVQHHSRHGLTNTISEEFMQALENYDWPGNVRELALTIERALAAAQNDSALLPEHLPTELRARAVGAALARPRHLHGESSATGLPAFKDFKARQALLAEKTYLEQLVAEAAGDPQKARDISGLSKSRMYDLLKKHDLSLT